jgi:adenine-specific DNA-methyltransferase
MHGTDLQRYPAIRRHLTEYKDQLTPGVTGGRKPGKYQWFEIQDNIAYWRKFDQPKIVSTKVSLHPTFAVDTSGCYLGNTAYFLSVKSGSSYLLALLNSNVFQAYAKATFVEKQNGWYEVQPSGLESFPVPTAEANQQRGCETLVEYILWLVRHARQEGSAKDPRDVLMQNYFEQILNGLIYELYFPDELHAHGLLVSDLVLQASLPTIGSISDNRRIPHLRELFESLYSGDHPLRGALHTLLSLETVRIIEGQP